MRPTTKDLAKHAGVSLATVDRVLNARPGVKQKTIEAVNLAIVELGFERNLSAANLAKRRTYRFDFLLPKHTGEFVAELDAQILKFSEAVRRENILLRSRKCISDDPHQIVEKLSRLSGDDVDGIAILAPQSPQVRDAISRLAERDIHVVELVSGQPGDGPHDFVGVDNYAAGATAARLLGGFCKQREGKVVVLTESINAADSVERRLGFDETMQRRFPGLCALPTLETHSNAARTDDIIANSFENHKDIVGIYIMNSEAKLPLESMQKLGVAKNRTIVAHERTKYTIECLKSEAVDALIAQHPGHIVRSAARLLRARCDKYDPIPQQDQIRIEVLLKENFQE